MDVGDDNSGRRSRRPSTWINSAPVAKIDQQRRDPGCTALPGHTVPHGTRRPDTGMADCESRPYQCTHEEAPRDVSHGAST